MVTRKKRMSNNADAGPRRSVRYDAEALLELESCRDATAVERMAHRWYLEPACGEQPAFLLAPRFSRVPALRIPVPNRDRPCEARAEGWCLPGWFNHLRISFPGAPFPVTVSHPTFQGAAPGREDRVGTSGVPQAWRGYALTVPAGTEYVEISKGEEMEACLVAVEFLSVDSVPPRVARPQPHANPVVAGIIDFDRIAGTSLQAYDVQSIQDFYHQMRAMGFTHVLHQIYGGSAGWSKVARPVGPCIHGHMSYSNWHEPGKRIREGVETLQADLDRIRNAGMNVVSSFRINNEWLARWAREYFGDRTAEIASVFSVEHPEFWATFKSGARTGGGLDFAFPEVRKYRLDIIAEWCDLFRNFDGICIDLHRHPPMVTYPEHLVQAFKEKTGIDVRTVEPVDEETMIPEWLAFRAEPFTEFMRSIRRLLNDRYAAGMFLTARVGNTFERALFEGADLKAWIGEGLVDQLVLQHRPPHNPVEADSRPIIAAAHEQGIQVVHSFGGDLGVNFPETDPSPVRPRLETWRAWGSDGFGYYEAERIAVDGRWLREMPFVVNAWTRGEPLT